jgi:hypothetical protein
MGMIDSLVSVVRESYDGLMGLFPSAVGQSVNVLILAILIAVVALFIWYFYRTLSQRNLISLNLSQYNTSDHPTMNKILATILYLLEYMILMPFLISLWFAALSVFVLLIASERSVIQILMLAASMVLAIRILAYSNGEISKDLAKLFPFITLSVFILTPGSFDLGNVLGRFADLPSLFTNIFYFLLVLLIVEILLRVVYMLIQLWRSREEISGEVVVVRKGK